MASERHNFLIVQQFVNFQVEQAENDASLVNIVKMRRQRRKASPRRCWVQPWLDVGRRLQFGHYHRLMPELRQEDPASFFNFLQVPPEMFDELLARLGPRCTKEDTQYRKAIEPGLKIAVTLRHLASHDKDSSMTYEESAMP